MSSGPIGLIGIGLLGTALAERLLGGGFSVVGYDLDAARRNALIPLGGQACEAPAEVAGRCDRLLLSLPTTAVVEAVLAELGSVLRPKHLIIDTTTGDPQRTAALGVALSARQIHYLDATIAGSSVQARQGDAILLLGGESTPVAACADLLACLAREWFHVGPCGSGARMKLVVNLILGLNRLVLAEGLSFARGCGFDLAETLRVLAAGPAYSRVMDTKGPKMIARDFAPQARLAQHLKDVRLIVQEADRTGAKVPLTLLHRALLERLEAEGFGGEDNAAIVRAYE